MRMSSHDKAFIGSIPEIYDSQLVPLILEYYAEDLAKQVAALEPLSVLETAAGSGVVARALAGRLSPEARYTITDLNRPMLDRAESRQPPDERIVWRQADALDLPYGDASFDVVVCQFGVMFYPDRLEGYTEALRVLKPGGTLVFSVWDRLETSEFALVVAQALASVFPDDPPEFMRRTPHGYHDEALIRRELGEAGFEVVTSRIVESTSVAPSARDVAIAFCQGTPLRYEIESRNARWLDRATDQAAEALSARFGQEAVEGKTKACVFTARRPA